MQLQRTAEISVKPRSTFKADPAPQMRDKTRYNVDLAVIGAGSGGLSIASGAAQLGRSVVLFEAAEMGGDCLNHGCVPSKAIISAGRHAQAHREGAAFGIPGQEPEIDFDAVKAHIQGVIGTIAPHDSQERFEGLGCTVIREHARFKNKTTVESDSVTVTAKRIVVATGSRASAPPIPGLDRVPYLTNETIFTVDRLPEHLLVIGSGPIGLELGQSFRRLGSDVTIIDIARPLAQSEPEHADAITKALSAEGIEFKAPFVTSKISQDGDDIVVTSEDGERLRGSHLLVAAGRSPVMDGLNLDAAGVDYSKQGIVVDDTLRTSNARVFAVGDVAAGRDAGVSGGLTHAAGYHGSTIIKSFYFLPPILDRMLAKATKPVPAAVYTEPELASVGLTEAQAAEQGLDYRITTAPFSGNDRAIAERETVGSVKIVATPKGHILGASVVGAHAGDLIQMLVLAMDQNMKLSDVAQMIAPYPTRGEAVKRAAGAFYTDQVFSSKTRKLAGILTKIK